MTAPGRSATSAVDDGGIEAEPGVGDATQPDAGAAEPLHARARGKATVLLAVAVLIPLALFTWRAMHAPVNFDGAMNLQVARRLADGDGYTRFYDELRVFPHEVQTNGPYVYVAAVGITLFGANQFAYQFSNLVYLAAFAGIVSVLLVRESAAVRIAGPFVVLLAVPDIPVYGLGGLGEVPTSCFLFAAILALIEALRSPLRSPWWVLGAAVAFGAAVATKTFAVGAAGVLAVGLACVVLAAPTRRLRWQVVLAAGAAALVPVAREVHRGLTFGSLGGYRAWWAEQSGGISAQSGFDDAAGGSPVRTFLDHVHVFSRSVDAPAELLLVVLCLPLFWVGALVLWRCRTQGVRRALTDPTLVLLLLIGGLAASYISWWMLVLPDSKLWIRRMIPGLLALHLLYLFLVPWLVRVVRAGPWRGRADGVPARRISAMAGVAGIAAVSLTAVPYGWDQIDRNTRAGLDDRSHEAWLAATRAAAAHVEENADQRYFGDDWWSAPVVSLMSGTDFYDLAATDACSLDPVRDRLVWDYDAKTILSHDPLTHDGTLVYAEMASFGGFVTIYSVGPSPGLCE